MEMTRTSRMVGWVGAMDGWLGRGNGWLVDRHKKRRGRGFTLSPFSYNFIAYSSAICKGCPSRRRDTNRLLALNRFPFRICNAFLRLIGDSFQTVIATP